jgi:hypothetical protein
MGKIKEFFSWRGGHVKFTLREDFRLKKVIDLIMDMGDVIEKKIGQHVG